MLKKSIGDGGGNFPLYISAIGGAAISHVHSLVCHAREKKQCV